MRKRRILVLVVIFIILNVAFARENDSNESNEGSSENNEQEQTLDNEEGDNEEGSKNPNAKTEHRNEKRKQLHTLAHYLNDELGTAPKDQHCKCNEGLDCKCDNSTLGNIQCHCADFDNLAKLNEGYSCKCEKDVLSNIRLKCQCARKDSTENIIKTVTCTSVVTYSQSHVRDISFGDGGKLQLYEKDAQEKKILMTGIKDINEVIDMLNDTRITHNFSEIIINIQHLKEIDAVTLLKLFLYHHEFLLQHFNMCGCKNVSGEALCHCNDRVDLYTVEQPAKCLCMPIHNQWPSVECMCNKYSHEPKLLYYPQIFEIFKSTCSRSDDGKNLICECKEQANFVFEYDKILVDIRAVEKDHITNIQTHLAETVEFKNTALYACNCTYAKPSWDCDCSARTTEYKTQNNLVKCLCLDQNKNGEKNQCLCSNHILEPTVLFNSEKVDMYGCACYNPNSQTKTLALKCDCKQREDKQEKYDDVVIDISKIGNANLTHVVNNLNNTAQFYQKHIDSCKCYYQETILICNCLAPMDSYTEENPSQCFCLQHPLSSTPNCICNPNLHSVNIIYALDIEIKECLCSRFMLNTHDISCKCSKKISYTYDYKNAMIDIAHWPQYTLGTILVQLLHTIQYNREQFNLCACTLENGKYSCSCHDTTMSDTVSNCFCISDNVFQTTTFKYCMCNLHFHTSESVRIRYQQTDDKYIEECTCNKGDKHKSLICEKCAIKRSVHRFSEKPYEGEVHIAPTTENQLKIILNTVFKNYVQKDREINKCQCSENLQDCICENDLRPYESDKGEMRCLCVADYYYVDRPLRCACNPRILDREVEFNERMYDIRFCYAYARRGDKNRVFCKPQRAPLPKYDFVIGVTSTALVHVHTIREYIIQARSEFEKEKFNMCNCKKVNNALECNCVENTDMYTEASKASCQCIAYGEDHGVECICSPHILQFEIAFYAQQTDIDGCRCYNKEMSGENQLICGECIRRTPLETHPRWTLDPIYHDESVIIPDDVENQLHVIISYVLKIFKPNDKVINHCQCTNNFKDCSCKYPVELYKLERAGHLHCLCVADFYYNDKPMQCACNPHILEPKITYLTSKYDIRRAHCFTPAASNGTGQNSLICQPADAEGELDHAADRVVIDIKNSLVIHTKNIFEYIIQQHDYQHENFTFCTCTNDDKFKCSCETETSKYTINHERNCLCIVPSNSSQNVECLCNAIVLQFGIMFEENYDLEGCRCYHSVDSLNKNELVCKSCIRRETYERNPHFIYHKNYNEKVIIKPSTDNQLSTIITHIVKQFNVNDRVVNYCKCKEDLTDCMCEYPVTPYLLVEFSDLNCFCIADYYYTDHPVRCGCNPYVLQPQVVYNTTKYDFRFVTCAHSNNKLICEQLNKEIIPEQINKIVVEVTESRIIEISHFVDYILEQKGYTGEHVNICGCEENNDGYLSCNCNGPTQALTITNTGSCLCLESVNTENKRNCICNPHILQLGLIFNSKIHLEGCHCYKSIYNTNSTSLTCTQCKKRESFELNPRFDYGISYHNTIVKLTEDLENQLIVVINYIFNYAKFSIQNRVINECTCEDDLSECTCNRPLLPYAGHDHKLRCLCIADYFYTTKALQCACNPFVWQLTIEHNPSFFDLRYIDCPITQETDKNSVKACVYLEGKPGPKPEDKVVVRIRKEVIVNIVVIMEFILRRVEYTDEKFKLCKCSISNEGHYSCNCDSETETCKKESRCSCLCVIPSASVHTEVIECMCNPRILQLGIVFNSVVNHLEGCRCYQVVNKDGTKSITCDKCIRRISYEHQTRFNLLKNYTKDVVVIHPSTENQIEVIQKLIVKSFDISDQVVNYCSCTENLINCQCESPIKQFITREGVLRCFCLADYYFDEHPIRCACNPLIVQPLLNYNETKYDFKYIDCVSRDLNGLIVTCNDTHKIVVTPHPVDRAVVVLKTPIKHHFADIIEYITTYHIYRDDDFNLCFDCTYANSQISCNCNKTTLSYNVDHTANCLCISNPGQEAECMCGSHILQIGIIFHDAKVKACRCYHSIEDKSSSTSLVCRDCFDRKSFEYNPRFDPTKNIYGALVIHIDDYIQNQIEYIYKIIVRHFTERNDQIMNFCQCLPNLETCNCKYSVEPYLIDGKLPCFCISDYYHEKYPYQCSCNPFILQPNVTCDERKFEFRYLDCTLVAHSEKDVICKERPSSPKPPSAEYKLVMRLRNIEVTIKIIQQYLLQNELYKYEPLISCKCSSNQNKYSCDCLNNTEVYNIHNKGYCLCITQKTGSLESTECLCNSRILQFGIVHHSNSTTLSGCHCYHSKHGNDKNSLVCGQCHDIKSFEFNPHFDKEHNYSSVAIAIPRYTEHQINAIIEVIFTKFNSSDQFVNHCECTENMEHCLCDYSISAYIQTNDKMPCLCVTDYFFEAFPVRCACNPFIIQPEYEYDPIKYDIRLVECTHSEESLKVVNCTQVKSKPPVAPVVIDTTVWREVQIKIIEEYILSYPHYADEQFNRCGCSWNDATSEFTCDCSEDTLNCAIENMCSCICVTPSGSKQSLGCTCNPRIFQIGYKYKSSINDFYGCRCYHSIASNRAKSLVCHSCKIVPSYEQQPHFKISFNYTELVINITNVIIQNQIEAIIPVIINHIPEIPHRLINYCNCLGDNTDCTCQYPVKSYFTQNEELTCLCITDYYYPDYTQRCGCNPFILQPSIIYDTPRYHFIRLICRGNSEDDLRMEKCQTLNAGGLTSIDQIVVDVSIERVVTIQTIITYILYHKIYKGEVFNPCTCHRSNRSPLSCTCIDPTVVCTAHEPCNCLCLSHSSQPENVECTCNPLSLQFGVIFNSTTIIMESCHFYHPLRDKDTRSLVAHECVRRESYDKHPHFNIDYVYNITGPIKINKITENQLSYVLEVVRIYFEKRDRIFNKCQCTENLSNCICKNPIHPYLQKDHKMPCLCIADYFYSDFPLQCGCNPFIRQVTFTTLVYLTSKFDFRWLECFEHDQSVKCTLIERKVEGPTSADKVVLDITRLEKINLNIIMEHILSYTQYVEKDFNECNCIMNNQNQLICNCNNDTTKYQIEKRCSCLCYKFDNNANYICSCNSHILQLGIVFNSSIVEITACRCYHEHNADNLYLKCDDCRKRESFEVNPRFDLRKEYKYEVEIRDEVENILFNILSVKHRRMEFNDRIVNYCDCPEHGNNCKCAHAVEPFIRDEQYTMPCFCISDYYYLIHPLRCACNPFVTQQEVIHNSRIFDFKVGNCVAYLGDKEQVTCSLKSLGNDPQYPEYKFVIKIIDLHIIDIGIIKEFLIKSMEFKYEEFNDCKCDSQLVCDCNKPTTAFNVTNKANCLCYKTSSSVDCICNPRILQVGIVFNPDKDNFLGCRCYRPRDSKTEDNLLCDECLQRESFEWNPRFDLNITYFGKTVYIPSDVENQIDVIFSYILSILELKHQIINHCKCSGNLLDCKCDYPTQAYSQTNNTMPCFCITDYYYKAHPVRCRCNPYILQLDIHYDSVKYDFIKADCISHDGDKDRVVCKVRPNELDISTDQVILDITHIVVIHITTITEYIFSFPQFRGEQFNLCQCTHHGTNGLKCDCKNDTSQLQIHNMRSCLCFTHYTNGQTYQPECICNAHILQIGIIFDSEIITWEGCRCYNPGSDSKTVLTCIQCHKIESLDDAPRFDIVNKNYSIGVIPVEVPALTENQLVIIRQYIIKIFEKNDRFTNECDCTEDFTSCQCRNTIKYYLQLNDKMPCFCISDYFYNDRPMRCDCNPFILQLNYKYDVTRFDFKYVECFGEREGKTVSCDVTPKPHLPQPRPPADLVVFDMTHITEIDIKHIYEHIWTYPQYHDHITKCKCLKNSDVLNCDCEDVTTQVTIQSKSSCLCFTIKDDEVECLCNPRILQLGLLFDSNIYNITGCRCYHSIHDYQTKTLVCDHCIPRISFSHNPRFDLSVILKYDVTLPNKTENIIVNILDITLNQTPFNNRLVDYCECSEDLKDCSCKYPITPYSVNNTLPCFCVADYFYTSNPIRCGCNPFVLEPNVIYGKTLYDIRHIHCTAIPGDSKKVNCVKIPGSPDPHNPEYKQVLRLRNVVVTITEIKALLSKNEVLKDEPYNLCTCHYIDGIQTCDCNDVTTQFTINHPGNCLCVYDDNKVDCICNPRILQIEIAFDPEKTHLKGCRCYHPKADEHTRSLICRNCVERNTFEINPRFDQTTNYTDKVVKIPTAVTPEMDDIYIYLVSQFRERDKIVNQCECLSDYKHCKCDYSIGPYSRYKDNVMPCVCMKDNLNGLYTVDCVCNPFMMQPTLEFENLKLSYAECISINDDKTDLNCTELPIKGPPPLWPETVEVEGPVTVATIIHNLEHVTKKIEKFNICNCTEISENDFEKGLSCSPCTYGVELYKQNKNTTCLCVYHLGEEKNSITECMCHNYVLQLTVFYDAKLNKLVNCECYYSENDNGLICPKCHTRPSAPSVPSFTNSNYTGVVVDIPLKAGVDMTIIRPIISNYLNGSDKMINRCWCADEFENCHCKFPPDSYARSDGKIYCVCADDYYNYAEPIQCGCNPFVWQLTYEYSKTKLDLRYMECETELNDKLDCVPRDHIKTTSLVVYNAKKIHLIDMNVVIEYLLKYPQYDKEDLILCSCTSAGKDKMNCKGCSGETVQYTTAEKVSCLCQQPKNARDKKPKQCVCNPFILQSEYIFNPENYKLTACRCFHKATDKSKETLTCAQCKARESYELHPRFDLSTDYRKLNVIISNTTENEISIFLNFLVKDFKVEDQVVNFCKCTEDSKNCTCEFPVKPYLNDTKMNCFCISDYYYIEDPIRCVCNPFIFHPSTHTFNKVQDVRKSYCIDKPEGGVTCEVFSGNSDKNSVYTYVLNIRTLRVVNIGIIKEYLFKSEEYANEPLISCDCTFNEDKKNGDKYDCSLCSHPTNMYTIHTRANCLCVMPVHKTTHSRIECLCGPHILQLGVIYNTKVTDLRGCRCYGNENDDGALTCTDCINRVSFELNPHFDLQISYKHVEVFIETYVENQIENLLSIITKGFEKDHQIVNLCECTDDYESCRCDYPVKPYSVANQLPCICILDHYFIDYPVRCGCNPYILHPKINYDDEKYILRFVECTDPNKNKENITCELTSRNVNLHLPRPIFVNLRGTVEIHIITILEYLFCYIEYQGETFNSCNCTKTNADLSCECQNSIESLDKNIMHNCLCILTGAASSSCICNPRVQQFGIVFNSSSTLLESCRCYHSTFDPNDNTLKCHECHRRDSISEHVRFYSTHNYSDVKVDTIYNMEVHIETIIEIFVRVFNSTDQIVNYCKCKENSESCICDYPITNYLIPNGELHCICIDDFYDNIYPVRCGCNPFVTQPTSSYNISQFSKEPNYFNFRQFICVQSVDVYNVKCSTLAYDHPLDTSVVSLHHLQYINIEIIQTYFLMKRTEKYNLCNCEYNQNGKLVCNHCNDITTQCSIKNPCNCFCIKDKNPKCLCNPRVLQFSLRFQSNVEYLGCRCYHSTYDKQSNRTLQCNECLNRVSIEHAPRFDIHVSYRHLTIVVPATLERRIDSLIALVISKFKDVHQMVLNCLCTKDSSPDCTCDYPYSLYAFDGILNCLCMEDNSNPEYGFRCACNPYILHPALTLDNWKGMDVIRMNCSSTDTASSNVHCEGTKVPPYDVVVKIPSVPIIQIQYILEIIQRIDVFTNQPFTLCDCQQTKNKSLDCNCQNNTLGYTIENQYSCLCAHNLKSALYRPVIECLCNPHIHQPRLTFDESVAMIDKCDCYNDGRYDNFLKCSCKKTSSYKIMYHNNYGHVTVELPQPAEGATSSKRLEQIRDTIIEKFAPEDKDYSHCRCMENMEKCTCAKSIQEYSYKTVTPCVCMPDHLNKTYPMACVCNRHLLQPRVKFDSSMYDLQDCDCFEHHGDMTNVTCHCNKKLSYEILGSNHNYSSSVIEIASTVQNRIESVSQIILKTFEKEDQKHNYCFCTEKFDVCKCVDPIMSYFYYSALPCLCMDEDLIDYPVRCMCNRYILEPVLKFDSAVFKFKDCYFALQHGDTIYPRCVETTNPRTRPSWLNELNFFGNTKLQTKETIERTHVVTKNVTVVGSPEYNVVSQS